MRPVDGLLPSRPPVRELGEASLTSTVRGSRQDSGGATVGDDDIGRGASSRLPRNGDQFSGSRSAADQRDAAVHDAVGHSAF